ncbi:ceramide-1-phosphate transfer protein-like isoform X2 [Protopterus annectens]|uniref:ceramide-1-phosphate transfer protein-like isoform X2 n=1 Tax=Protopterus annectens TaxID=7888 RepID=UPI001CFB1508|nr:ceramide-1-phosphate transfer protein-like isoform X2 [Protopterus annectens]
MDALGLLSLRYVRLSVPLTILLLLIYFLSVQLHVPLYGCNENGKHCNEKNKPVEKHPGIENNQVNLEIKPEKTDHFFEHIRHCEGKDFQISRLVSAFESCVTVNNEILLKEYLSGWSELVRFMNSLGTVFSFISYETTKKMKILRDYQSGPHAIEYHTLQSMVKYELKNHIVNFHEPPSDETPSGCRTLLRLHRALKWLELFLFKLANSHDNEKTSDLCIDTYQYALARYHNWFVRQAAVVAFLAMPEKRELFEIVCVKDKDEAKLVLTRTVHSLSKVYNITQKVYEKHRMLDLP